MGDFSLESGGNLSQKGYHQFNGSMVTKKLKDRQTDKDINRQTFPRSMRSYTVKEDHIGSVVTEKIRYRQTHELTDTGPATFIQG